MSETTDTNKDELTKKKKRPATKPLSEQKDDFFDDEFETLETTFPPIYSFRQEGDILTFIPLGVSEGPNGTLILCELVSATGEGEFVLKEEAYDLNKGDNFALGVKTVFVGDNKLVTAAEKGKLTELSMYCRDKHRPVRLIYKGKAKSQANKMFKYDTFDIQFTKDVMATLKD